MAPQIDQAMVLAAGFGTRMGDATQKTAKALIPLGRQKMIDYPIAALKNYGCQHIIVNIHAFADQMSAHLKQNHPSIMISDESALLMNNGGALAYARHFFKDEPFFVHNCDSFFPIPLAEQKQILTQSADFFDPNIMDGLLLLQKIKNKKRVQNGDNNDGDNGEKSGENNDGDFTLLDNHQIKRGGDYLYIGVQILTLKALQDLPQKPFPMEKIWQEAMKRQRLYGFVLNQKWLHLGTQKALKTIPAFYKH